MKKGKRDKVTGRCGGIALILGVDTQTAERFVREVQAIFPDRDSSVKAISAYLRTHGPSLSDISPVRVAAGLRAAAYGLPVPSKSREAVPGPGNITAEVEPSTRSIPDQAAGNVAASAKKHPSNKRGKRVRGPHHLGEEIEPSVPPAPHHDAREATSQLAKCPHGVLMIRPCPICKRGDTTPYD